MRDEKNISMKVVKKKTGLTARQVRYYDQMGLIFPARSEGNQRLFSGEDVKRLEKIKELLERGYTIEAVREKLNLPKTIGEDGSEYEYDPFRVRLDGTRKLTSLYPVSNRSGLMELLRKENREQKEE